MAPPGGAFDAMGHGQIFALLGVQVIRFMGIAGKEDGAVKTLDLLNDPGEDGHGFGSAQGAVDKVGLHVDHYQYIFFHFLPPGYLV